MHRLMLIARNFDPMFAPARRRDGRSVSHVSRGGCGTPGCNQHAGGDRVGRVGAHGESVADGAAWRGGVGT